MAKSALEAAAAALHEAQKEYRRIAHLRGRPTEGSGDDE
jgi:signal transduction histidine kinase